MSALPPGPKLPRPLLTLLFIRSGPKLLDRCQARYGDLFTLSGLIGDVVVTSNPELIKRIFTETGDSLYAGVSNSFILGTLLGEHSLLTLDGPEHMRQRKLILPSFQGERMRSYKDLIANATDAGVAGWSPGQVIPLRLTTQAITLEVIMQAVFGLSKGPRYEQTKAGLKTLLDMAGKPYSTVSLVVPALRKTVGRKLWQHFVETSDEIDRLLFAEIDERRSAGGLEERGDILSTMLLARDEEGNAMSNIELRDELMTLLVAGHETTATALAWAFHWLLRNPVALNRLKSELKAGDESYLDAVIKETLRLVPTVPAVARQATADFELGGYTLPAGTGIAANIYLTHRRPDLYKEPLQFKPERFIDGKAETYSWIPFGGGIRRCIGASFAMYEMKVAIPRMLERAELAAVGGSEEPRRRTVTLAPAHDTRVKVIA